jgi:hypothetical protein
MLILASFIILFFVYLAVNPGMLQEIQQLTLRMQSIQNEEAIFNLLGPYLVNPKVLFAGWFFIAVLVPLVEEALKPLGLWFISRRIITPAQGFALGALSGAAYALVESIGSSATAAKEIWIAAVIARAGADVLHVFNTALMGWALVSAWQQRKFWRLALVYLFVIFTHGLWNSASIVTGLSSLSGYDFFQQSTWLKTLLPYAATTMLILLAGMFTGLVGMNLKLRKEDQIAKNKTTQELFESITSDDSEISKKDTDGI